MADVFISYKSERRAAAKHLADVLKANGYSVWFDYELIKGEGFRLKLDAELRQAKAVVVLWCALSVESEWVDKEAGLAEQRRTMVPVRIEDCDIKVAYHGADTIDLRAWDGSPRSHVLDSLLRAVGRLVGRTPNVSWDALASIDDAWRHYGSPSLARFALGKAVEVAPSPAGNQSADDRLFAEAERVGSIEAYAFYLSEYPAGIHAGVARFRMKGLNDAAAAREAGARQLAEQERLAREHAVAEQRRLEEERARAAEEDAYRRGGRLPIRIGSGANETIAWAKPGAGEVFRDFEGGPQMLVVPAGSFTMGSNEYDDEKPPHKVTFAKPFAVGRFAVTFAEWDSAGLPHKPGDEGWGRADRPAINVGWEDARAYAQWLSKKTGKTYRLLTEAEWEYCCRAGTTTRYWWGDKITPEQANYYASNHKKTLPVESYNPNSWGLYQVHGNVWEWVEDAWHPNYQGAPTDGSVWQGGEPSSRVVRGGSWGYLDIFVLDLRSANRNWVASSSRASWLGFRLARTL